MSTSIKNDIQQVDAVSTRNMATTSMDAELIRSLRPEKFRKGDDLDVFIKNFERYFEAPISVWYQLISLKLIRAIFPEIWSPRTVATFKHSALEH